jgi:hypothetical protein
MHNPVSPAFWCRLKRGAFEGLDNPIGRLRGVATSNQLPRFKTLASRFTTPAGRVEAPIADAAVLSTAAVCTGAQTDVANRSSRPQSPRPEPNSSPVQEPDFAPAAATAMSAE